MAETYNDYPQSATNNAKRALKYKDENPDNDCGTRVGWERANQLASRESISRDTIARMASFKRHQQHKDVPYSEGCGGLMWDAWGGTSGIEWAIRKLEQIDNAASSKMQAVKQVFAFASVQESARIDRSSGTMQGVSLISVGEAKGHESFVDEDSLDTALSVLKEKMRLPAYITHRGALFEDRLTREIGMFENFRVEGEQLKADFQAFESFMEDDKRKFNRLFELAEKMPDRFGLSIVFAGTRAWATPEGDVPMSYKDDERPEGALFEFPSIRVMEVSSADFVDSPAANERGLFSKIDNPTHSNMTKDELSKKTETLEAEKVELSEKLTELESKLEGFDALLKERDEMAEKVTAVESALIEKDEELNEALDGKSEVEKALGEKTKEAESLAASNEKIQSELDSQKAEVKRLNDLINGSEFRNGVSEASERMKLNAAKEERKKRIREYANEHGIEESQAVVQLSRKEPQLWQTS